MVCRRVLVICCYVAYWPVACRKQDSFLPSFVLEFPRADSMRVQLEVWMSSVSGHVLCMVISELVLMSSASPPCLVSGSKGFLCRKWACHPALWIYWYEQAMQLLVS